MLSVIFVNSIELKNDYKIDKLLYLIVYKFGHMCHHIVRRTSNVFDPPPLQAWDGLVSLRCRTKHFFVFNLLQNLRTNIFERFVEIPYKLFKIT